MNDQNQVFSERNPADLVREWQRLMQHNNQLGLTIPVAAAASD